MQRLWYWLLAIALATLFACIGLLLCCCRVLCVPLQLIDYYKGPQGTRATFVTELEKLIGIAFLPMKLAWVFGVRYHVEEFIKKLRAGSTP